MNYKEACTEITQRILDELKKGIIPWHKPWFGGRNGAIKWSTGEPYSFLNQLLLGEPGEYIGYKACAGEGGRCLKGMGKKIYHYNPPVFEVNKDTGEKELKHPSSVTTHYVWRVGSGTTGVQPRWEEKLPDSVLAPDKRAEVVVDTYLANNPSLKLCRENISGEAYYAPLTDTINVPAIEQYKELAEYYSTLYHEMVHSTGAKSRLNRLDTTDNAAFGSKSYSKEELVAEIGAASLLSYIGMEVPSSFKNSVAYIQNWIQRLEDDPKFIVYASNKASKAMEFILNGKEGN